MFSKEQMVTHELISGLSELIILLVMTLQSVDANQQLCHIFVKWEPSRTTRGWNLHPSAFHLLPDGFSQGPGATTARSQTSVSGNENSDKKTRSSFGKCFMGKSLCLWKQTPLTWQLSQVGDGGEASNPDPRPVRLLHNAHGYR